MVLVPGAPVWSSRLCPSPGGGGKVAERQLPGEASDCGFGGRAGANHIPSHGTDIPARGCSVLRQPAAHVCGRAEVLTITPMHASQRLKSSPSRHSRSLALDLGPRVGGPAGSGQVASLEGLGLQSCSAWENPVFLGQNCTGYRIAISPCAWMFACYITQRPMTHTCLPVNLCSGVHCPVTHAGHIVAQF